jgi:signal transduction histidine kinase/CheY-like chemotaxis protein
VILTVLLGISIGVAGWQYWLRRRAVRALAEATAMVRSRERKMATILEHAPIVFSAIDARGIFHISEGKGLRKLGRHDNQSVGLSIYEMHHHNPIILDAVDRALKGEAFATNFVLNDISFELFIGPEVDVNGVVVGASMLSVDVSDRAKIEQEKIQLQIREETVLETSKLKSEFLATMSHEIRTPINGVIGVTNLLLDTPLNMKQRQYAEAIKDSGSSLLSVINDILDFSKIEAGKMEFEEIDFNLPEFFCKSLKSFFYIADQKNITLVTEVDPQLPVWVRGDPGRFRQIINNLVSNAIKFTEKGQVSVQIMSTAAENGNFGIRVEVRDSGIGISEDMIQEIFRPFSQAEASLARRYGGTGLGLSICKRLVDQMGGTIGVKSETQVGSTFWVDVLFCGGQENTEIQKNETISKALLQSGRDIRILVAEDNAINQMITTAMLSQMGYISVVVGNGMEALEALSGEDFDLVLMDYQMPRMDGLEATRQFRNSLSARNRGIPILAMTANAMLAHREECLLAGMDDYVTKPVSMEVLSQVISRWLEDRHRQLEQQQLPLT